MKLKREIRIHMTYIILLAIPGAFICGITTAEPKRMIASIVGAILGMCAGCFGGLLHVMGTPDKPKTN
jgi:hypothetical protein